jgi:hypothetical protein
MIILYRKILGYWGIILPLTNMRSSQPSVRPQLLSGDLEFPVCVFNRTNLYVEMPPFTYYPNVSSSQTHAILTVNPASVSGDYLSMWPLE